MWQVLHFLPSISPYLYYLLFRNIYIRSAFSLNSLYDRRDEMINWCIPDIWHLTHYGRQKMFLIILWRWGTPGLARDEEDILGDLGQLECSGTSAENLNSTIEGVHILWVGGGPIMEWDKTPKRHCWGINLVLMYKNWARFWDFKFGWNWDFSTPWCTKSAITYSFTCKPDFTRWNNDILGASS